MPRGLGRLPFLTRRSTSFERRTSEHPTMAAASADPDAAPVGRPVLLPASIVRQVLFHATEITPVWARPRPEPASGVVAAEPVAVAAKPATRRRTPRASTGGASAAAPTKATGRRPRGSTHSAQGKD